MILLELKKQGEDSLEDVMSLALVNSRFAKLVAAIDWAPIVNIRRTSFENHPVSKDLLAYKIIGKNATRLKNDMTDISEILLYFPKLQELQLEYGKFVVQSHHFFP